MKMTVKTSRTAGFLEKAFRVLNKEYFEGLLEEPIITIQSTPKAYGHVTVGKTWNRADGEERHELNIGAGTLDRPIEEVIATLMHEMVHIYNIQNGVKDTSRGYTYHNKHFRDEAEARDLKISYDKRIGWSITEPTEALIEFIIAEGWEDIRMSRKEGCRAPGAGTGDGDNTPKPSSTRKYICPGCGQSVRATKKVNIRCGVCDLTMVEN